MRSAPNIAGQSSSASLLITTASSPGTDNSSVWQYRRKAEDLHSPAANISPKGEPAAAKDVALPALKPFNVHCCEPGWPSRVSRRRTCFRKLAAEVEDHLANCPASKHGGNNVNHTAIGWYICTSTPSNQDTALWPVFPFGQSDVERVLTTLTCLYPDRTMSPCREDLRLTLLTDLQADCLALHPQQEN